MIVILDSNIYTSDFYMRGNNFYIFLDYIKRADIELFIPTLILEEVKHNFYSTISNTKAQIDKQIANLTRRIGDKIADNPITEEVLEKKCHDYSNFLKTKIEDYNIKVLEYPDISHEKVSKRAILKRKPFKENGDGYRDTIIWETLLELGKKEDREIIFITRNTSDFCDLKGNSYNLHKDLRKEITENKIELYIDLKHYLEQYVLPKFDRKEAVIEQILQEEYPFENIFEMLSNLVISTINNYGTTKAKSLKSEYYENPRLLSFEKSPKIDITDVRELKDNEMYISANMQTLCDFEGYVRKYNLSNVEYYHFYQDDNNIGYFVVLKQVKINIDFNFVFSQKDNVVVKLEVENVEEI